MRLAGVSKTHLFVTGLYNGFFGVQTFFVFTEVISFFIAFLIVFLTTGDLTTGDLTTGGLIDDSLNVFSFTCSFIKSPSAFGAI